MLTGGLGSTLDSLPRKTVPIGSNGGRLFREEGIWNYTTMLLRDDLNLLILGAREAIFALDLDDITIKKAMLKWEVTRDQQNDCSNKGKDATNDCKNYIRILHKKDDGRMYVCGTKAFNPTCGYLSYGDGKLFRDPPRRYEREMSVRPFSAIYICNGRWSVLLCYFNELSGFRAGDDAQHRGKHSN